MSIFEKTFEVPEEDKPTKRTDNENRVFTFQLEQGASARIVFLTDEPPSKVYVHNIYNPSGPKFNAPWDMACIKTLTGKSCPYCKQFSDGSTSLSKKFNRFPIWIYPIIDMTPYEIKSGDKKGEIIPFTRKAFVCKYNTQQLLNEQFGTRKEAGDSTMVGMCLKASRSDKDKSARVGDSFAYFNHMDMKQFGDVSTFSQEELESLVLCDAGEIMARYEKIIGGSESATAPEPDEAAPMIDYGSDGIPF